MAKILTTMIKTCLYSGVVATGTLLFYARQTLPSEASFTIEEGTFGRFGGFVTRSGFQFKDLYFFRLAIWEKRIMYIGIFQSWIRLE